MQNKLLRIFIFSEKNPIQNLVLLPTVTVLANATKVKTSRQLHNMMPLKGQILCKQTFSFAV